MPISWSDWNYSRGIGHHRYYRGTEPYSKRPCYGAVEKHGDTYRWAVFPPGEKTIYGESGTLPQAKRDCDRAEATSRLTAARDTLTRLEAQTAEARAECDRITAELRHLRAGKAA